MMPDDVDTFRHNPLCVTPLMKCTRCNPWLLELRCVCKPRPTTCYSAPERDPGTSDNGSVQRLFSPLHALPTLAVRKAFALAQRSFQLPLWPLVRALALPLLPFPTFAP